MTKGMPLKGKVLLMTQLEDKVGSHFTEDLNFSRSRMVIGADEHGIS